MPSNDFKRLKLETTEIWDIDKNLAIDFLYCEIKSFPPLSDKPQGSMNQKLLWWRISNCRELLPKERRIGWTVTEL